MTALVLLRVRAHRALLAAALLTVLLTTCVLSALAAFSGAVGDAGLRRALQGPSASGTLLEVQATVTGQNRDRLDRAVRAAAGTAYDGLPVTVAASTRSGPYGLPRSLRPPGAPKRDGDDPDLTLLATFDRSRITITEGTAPGPATGAGPVPVALPEAAARALRLRPGAVVTLADRLGGRPLTVRLTGIYRPADPGALYWRLDRLGGRGVQTLAFTTYGPLLADPSVFAGRVAPAETSWQARADFSTVTAGRTARLAADMRAAVARISAADGGVAQASSDLPQLLTALRRGLLVSRSTLMVGASQLVVLAAFALLLVSRTLAEERTGESFLLRARGASRTRIASLAAAEALLLTLPAAVAAPLLAGPLVRALAGQGALARAGLRLDGATAAAWWVAAATALACALAVAGPALRRSVAPGAAVRGRALPGVVRAGGDVALLVLAGLAYWQLSRRSSGTGVLSAGTDGALGVDPVLVAAPALCLLAGTVLVLRLLPPAAWLAGRRAARGRGLPAALAGWQLARRPGRGAGPALLLVLAVAMSMFAVGQGAGWADSQRDQADFAVGADIRVTGSTTPPFGQSAVYADLPGVRAAAPAARTEAPLPGDSGDATVLAMDTDAAAGVIRLRGDLADRPLPRLLAPLHTTGSKAGFTLPDGTGQLLITARLTASGGSGGVTQQITVTVEDRYGVRYSLTAGDLPADGRTHVLTADLAAEAGQAPGAGPAGPLRLTGLTAGYLVPEHAGRHQLVIGALRSVGADGRTRTVRVARGVAWQADARIDNPDILDDPKQGYATARAGRAASTPDTPLSVSYRTGAAPPQPYSPETATLTLRAVAPPAPALTGVASDAYLRAVDARVGDTVRVELSGAALPVRITGSVRALPTAGAGPALLLDLRAADRALGDRGEPALEPGEWWLATDPGASARVAAALRDRPDATTLLVRDEEYRRLRADPLGAAPQAALPAAVVAAAVLAAVGFAVAAVGAVRERTAEFAVLRALGAPRRLLARVLATEQGLLAAVATAVGLALGALLTRLVVPLVVLTAQATHPVPPVTVHLPATPLIRFLATVLLVPLAVVAATALRPTDPARTMRHEGGA